VLEGGLTSARYRELISIGFLYGNGKSVQALNRNALAAHFVTVVLFVISRLISRVARIIATFDTRQHSEETQKGKKNTNLIALEKVERDAREIPAERCHS